MIIVIGRQFGSGGRRIGKLVADKLGIPYYDKELLREAADRLGFSPDVFAEADERRPAPFQAILQGMTGIADIFHPASLSPESLYQRQSKAILDICEAGDCVIVGRTADHILSGRPDMVSVFLHAPLDWRAEKIVRRGDCNCCETARDHAVKKDRARQDYYNYFTGRRWGHADNYHLTLDASLLSEDSAADLIISFAKSKKDQINPGRR